jgi:hypothetical protein
LLANTVGNVRFRRVRINLAQLANELRLSGRRKIAVAPLPLRLDLFKHSPTDFSWGYGGNGSAQLALALLADALGDDDRALQLHQDFKFKVVACWPEGERWWITAEQIAAVVKVIEQEAVPITNEQDGAAGAASSRAFLSTGGPDAA